jgi:hypothetical protein
MIVISEATLSEIINDCQFKIERGARKIYNRTGRPGEGIDTGMNEIRDGVNGLKVVQKILCKHVSLKPKLTVSYSE